MNRAQEEEFVALCDTIAIIIDNYQVRGRSPAWLWRFWEPRGPQIRYIQRTIASLKASITPDADFNDLRDELIRQLDSHRYYLAVRAASKQLRFIMQDTLIAALCFTPADVALYNRLLAKQVALKDYVAHFQRPEELLRYYDYFSKRHAVFGIAPALLGEQGLMLSAKAGLVDGKLVEHFGIRKMIALNMQRLNHELADLLEDKIERGFLTQEKIEGYMHKIHLVLDNCESATSEFNDETLVQHARYLLESIINTAGLTVLGTAQYPEHAVLITACYWIDEVFLQARGAAIR
jgi:hypothetical protein